MDRGMTKWGAFMNPAQVESLNEWYESTDDVEKVDITEDHAEEMNWVFAEAIACRLPVELKYYIANKKRYKTINAVIQKVILEQSQVTVIEVESGNTSIINIGDILEAKLIS